MYLSYSGKKIAVGTEDESRKDGCMFRYWNMYINRTPLQREDDRLGSIYGTSTGKLFEAFYAKKLWREKDTRGAMEALVSKVVGETLREEVAGTRFKPGGIIKWRSEGHPSGIYANREELENDVRHAIPRGLQTIKENKFLGKDAKAEMNLNVEIEGHTFGGRADFVMTRVGFGDHIILDGKGGRNVRWDLAEGRPKDRWTNPGQLKWYALLLREKHGKMADWVGFLFWKNEPPYNVAKYEFSHADLDDLKHKTLVLMEKIERLQGELPADPEKGSLPIVKAKFEPAPSDENCRFCPYASDGVCEGGAKIVRKLEKKAKERRQ